MKTVVMVSWFSLDTEGRILVPAGKTSVVTGGNSGIGIETVRALASAGSRVILCSRSIEAGEKVARELKADGVKVVLCHIFSYILIMPWRHDADHIFHAYCITLAFLQLETAPQFPEA
jgi:NAD(P)-dependent dehydrogenase (short-subunit alcohol dehydrogenase family)